MQKKKRNACKAGQKLEEEGFIIQTTEKRTKEIFINHKPEIEKL